MDSARRLSGVALVLALTVTAALPARGAINVRNYSSDRPLVLDQDADYVLHNVSVTGVRDDAALVLTGRINSLTLKRCTFGNVRMGETGRAAGVEATGATVGAMVATDSIFYDAEVTLASLREGSFGVVSFQRCNFRTSDEFLRQIYASNPWRNWPPVTEFYNIDRLELLDNTFSNTVVIIHPSVKKVIIRGNIPGLQVHDQEATQVIRLQPGQPLDGAVAAIDGGEIASAAR